MTTMRKPLGEDKEDVHSELSTGAGLPSLHHRFVRLNPRFDNEETLRLLKVGSSARQECRTPLVSPFGFSTHHQEFFVAGGVIRNAKGRRFLE
jgi:hypothetical protein